MNVKCFVVRCVLVEKSLFCDSFHMHRKPDSTDNPVFFQIQSITQTAVLNVRHNFCSVMCYTVLIGTLILLTLGNNIL